jgi:cyclophilin family peptidyl-prolyl cis-trans isomerase
MARLLEEFPNDVRVAYRHFPLVSIHDKALLSTQAAEAAGLQGKFWEMHDLLFERQGEWVEMAEDAFKEWVIGQAGELSLDVEKFTADLSSETIKQKALDTWDKGVASGMPGTPFLLINGSPYQGPLSYANLEAIATLVLLERRQFTSCPPMTIDANKRYTATLKTEKGDIVLELYADQAPLAVNSFIYLAQNGWFDGVTFHRVIPGFVAQAGDPTGSGYGGPGYAFDNEIVPELTFDGPGVLAMANAGPGSNGSQFFITLSEQHRLDGGYTIFGRVVSGMEVVQALTPRNPEEGMSLPPGDAILGVTIEEQ